MVLHKLKANKKQAEQNKKTNEIEAVVLSKFIKKGGKPTLPCGLGKDFRTLTTPATPFQLSFPFPP